MLVEYTGVGVEFAWSPCACMGFFGGLQLPPTVQKQEVGVGGLVALNSAWECMVVCLR